MSSTSAGKSDNVLILLGSDSTITARCGIKEAKVRRVNYCDPVDQGLFKVFQFETHKGNYVSL